MKKKMVITTLVLLLIMGLFICFLLYKSNQEKKVQERYNEIRESVKKAVEWNISAQYPKCSISKEFKETNSPGTFYNSNFLIKNGYIKREELLDVDNESFCDVYVDINTHYEDPLDYQQNCEIYYKISLKCKDFEEKGYVDWGL